MRREKAERNQRRASSDPRGAAAYGSDPVRVTRRKYLHSPCDPPPSPCPPRCDLRAPLRRRGPSKPGLLVRCSWASAFLGSVPLWPSDGGPAKPGLCLVRCSWARPSLVRLLLLLLWLLVWRRRLAVLHLLFVGSDYICFS